MLAASLRAFLIGVMLETWLPMWKWISCQAASRSRCESLSTTSTISDDVSPNFARSPAESAQRPTRAR